MKKLVFGIGAMVMVLLFASCEKEEFVGVESLPTAAKTFLDQHFAELKISNVKREKEGLSGTEYTAYLENGTKITFDKNGNWIEADAAAGQSLPTSFIHPNIVEYVETNYPSAGINSIEKDGNRFDVELTNGLDLEFNANGEFIRID